MSTETKTSHKIFSIIMLVLIVGTTIGTFVVTTISIIEHKQEQKANEEAYAELLATSDVESEA